MLALIKGNVSIPAYGIQLTCGASDAVGDPVRISGNNTVTKALATTEANARVLGFIRHKGTLGSASSSGASTCYISHFYYKSGLSGLTAGNVVYLSDTGTVSASAGTFAKVVGIAISTTEALLMADSILAQLAATYVTIATAQTVTGVKTMSGANVITHANTGLRLLDTAGDHYTSVVQNSNEGANRTLNIPALGADDTLATLGTAQTFTGAKTFANTGLLVRDTGSDHTTTIKQNSDEVANRVLNIPALGGDKTVALIDLAQTFTAAQTVKQTLAVQATGSSNQLAISHDGTDAYLATSNNGSSAFLASKSSGGTAYYLGWNQYGELYATAGNKNLGADTVGWSRMYMGEVSDPAAPSTDNAVVYCRDNGAGKTQLCVRFSSGAVQVIATEP